jgi:hypothetical protein
LRALTRESKGTRDRGEKSGGVTREVESEEGERDAMGSERAWRTERRRTRKLWKGTKREWTEQSAKVAVEAVTNKPTSK